MFFNFVRRREAENIGVLLKMMTAVKEMTAANEEGWEVARSAECGVGMERLREPRNTLKTRRKEFKRAKGAQMTPMARIRRPQGMIEPQRLGSASLSVRSVLQTVQICARRKDLAMTKPEPGLVHAVPKRRGQKDQGQKNE